MREVLKDLTTEQIEFICNECSITEEELYAMDDDRDLRKFCVIDKV